MKMTHALPLVCLLAMAAICGVSAQPHQPDLQKPFRDYGFEGSITVFDYKQRKWITSDSTDSQLETVPASTFKIPNLLIALEAGVIGSEMDTVGWIGSIDTTLYGYRPSTYRHMTVRHAFEVSAGWVFMELAKKVGRQRYEQVLRDIGYGNASVSDGADFWNFGPLKVSPRDQVEMLVNVYEGKLPFSNRNLDILKDVMVTERTDEYTIRSKTGWGVQDSKDIGWWVGYLQQKDNVYFFATRITKVKGTPRADFMKCRLEITKAVLRQLGAL
ncbi:penicillin-binding transpeptidase domain-containing protein [Parapedobacter sp. 2B3]|uniref:penicillin-binding transpeptidase domain-containing protein n=1 Tax=Parapedobacter sp. 2B3 TaxID=3342381 RepID=UPI0035B65C23